MINSFFSGNKIKEIRLKNGLTQSELARKANINPKILSYWEVGTKIPTNLKILNVLASVLNCTLQDFTEIELYRNIVY